MIYGYVYCIHNKVNGKEYIGRTKRGNPVMRYREHLREAFNPVKRAYNKPLYCAIRKYGVDNFTFSVLVTAENEKELNLKETQLIQQRGTFRRGYNMTVGGDGVSSISLLEELSIVRAYEKCGNVREVSRNTRRDVRTIADILNRHGISMETRLSNVSLNAPKKVVECIHISSGSCVQCESTVEAAKYIAQQSYGNQGKFSSVWRGVHSVLAGKGKSVRGFLVRYC